MKVGDIVELEFDSVYCCEPCVCDDIISNNFTCPVCNNDYVDVYPLGSLDPDKWSDGSKHEITCGNCKSRFAKVSEFWYDECRATITYINPEIQ